MSADGVPEPFDEEHLAAVASEYPVTAERLRELLDEHQAVMERLPGAENLVYEWRKQFDATVLARSEGWYFVAAPEWAWDEFADTLEVNDAEMTALAAVHERTIREHSAVSGTDVGDATPMIVLRA